MPVGDTRLLPLADPHAVAPVPLVRYARPQHPEFVGLAESARSGMQSHDRTERGPLPVRLDRHPLEQLPPVFEQILESVHERLLQKRRGHDRKN